MANSTSSPPRWRDKLLDRSVVLSYDRRGFERHARAFAIHEPERDLRGQVVLITGANSGIGKAAARALAARKAEIWMLCRSQARGAAARDELVRDTGNDDIQLGVVDLSDQGEIRRFAASFDRPRVDVLIHNAAVLPDERVVTSDGVELTVATNLVGPFLLTWLLHHRLLRSPDSRIVQVTSGGMYPRRLSVSRLRCLEGPFDGVKAYADTKRALVVLGELLAERLEGTSATVHTTHPGWVDTPAVRTSIPTFYRITKSILRTPEQGADTIVWLTTSSRDSLGSGRLWFDRAAQPTHLLPWTREQPAERERLWHQLHEWTGLDPQAEWTTPSE